MAWPAVGAAAAAGAARAAPLVYRAARAGASRVPRNHVWPRKPLSPGKRALRGAVNVMRDGATVPSAQMLGGAGSLLWRAIEKRGEMGYEPPGWMNLGQAGQYTSAPMLQDAYSAFASPHGELMDWGGYGRTR